jgi:hypothetical protein
MSLTYVGLSYVAPWIHGHIKYTIVILYNVAFCAVTLFIVHIFMLHFVFTLKLLSIQFL